MTKSLKVYKLCVVQGKGMQYEVSHTRSTRRGCDIPRTLSWEGHLLERVTGGPIPFKSNFSKFLSTLGRFFFQFFCPL